MWPLSFSGGCRTRASTVMDYQQAPQRFSYHASITDAEGEGWSSFAEALLDARAKTQFRLREPTADLIACLEMVNRHVGGQQSSASLDTAERSIDACVAYAVSAVISDQSSCTRPILCTRSKQGRVARIQCLESGVGGRHQLPLLRQTPRPPRRLGGSHGTRSGCSF